MDDVKPMARPRARGWADLVIAVGTALGVAYLPQRMGSLEERMTIIDRRQVRVEQVIENIADRLGVPPRPMVARPKPQEEEAP